MFRQYDFEGFHLVSSRHRAKAVFIFPDGSFEDENDENFNELCRAAAAWVGGKNNQVRDQKVCRGRGSIGLRLGLGVDTTDKSLLFIFSLIFLVKLLFLEISKFFFYIHEWTIMKTKFATLKNYHFRLNTVKHNFYSNLILLYILFGLC